MVPHYLTAPAGHINHYPLIYLIQGILSNIFLLFAGLPEKQEKTRIFHYGFLGK
jgi:hypothetical protein